MHGQRVRQWGKGGKVSTKFYTPLSLEYIDYNLLMHTLESSCGS